VLREIFNLGHFPLFGMIAVGVILRLRKDQLENGWRVYCLAWTITLILTVLTECIQLFMPDRFFEFRDMVVNMSGATCFLIFAYPFPPNRHKVKKILWSICVVYILWLTIPLAEAIIEQAVRQQRFPEICSFETRLETSRWRANDASSILRSKQHVTHGIYSLRMDLAPGIYPGAQTGDLIRNWRGYEVLVFDTFLEGSIPMKITLKITDITHNGSFSDRYNGRLVLHPGKNQFHIKLEEIKHAPKERMLDIEQISDITLFAYKLDRDVTIYVDHFRLE